MNKLASKVLGAAKQPKKTVKLIGKQFYVLFRFGPIQYGEYLKRAVTRHVFAHNFPNGIKTNLDKKKAKNWHLLHKRKIVIILLSESKEDISSWMLRVSRETPVHFLMSDAMYKKIHGPQKDSYSVLMELSARIPSLYRIKQHIHRQYRGYDVLFLDNKNPLIEPFDIVRLQHAAYTYDDDREIGFVSPAYIHNDEIVAGYEYDRDTQRWLPCEKTKNDYGQVAIPRYVLTTLTHGLYVTHHTIQRLTVTSSELKGSLDTQIGTLVMRGWKQNIRTLIFSPVVMKVESLIPPVMGAEQQAWQKDRRVINENSDVKIIYVLNATSVSGGIRVIFEHANGLLQRGFDVEIWSLQGQPTWTDLDVSVKKFRTYSDMLLSLRNEDAIKVATWWETDQIVWLASANRGVPVNFVQEFETWFYPDDSVARAAVVSSYRKEFAYMTTADYQRDELRDIGIESPVIPVGYEEKYYHQDKKVQRKDDTVLALGRSFFQKNFAMTVRAWKKLGEQRPHLLLFGSEPDIVKDEKVTYVIRPSNEEVNTLYNQAICFVQTSRHEGFSLPIIEAMAAGCPVITTDSHGNRGFCHHEQNCIIVEQDNDEALAQAMSRLLGDKELQEKFRKAGLETAKKYQWSVILDELADFYRKLI